MADLTAGKATSAAIETLGTYLLEVATKLIDRANDPEWATRGRVEVVIDRARVRRLGSVPEPRFVRVETASDGTQETWGSVSLREVLIEILDLKADSDAR